ncbi:3 beta-hydroxysteroid dehydrogenase/Delta 5--_4-isomerase [Aquisphaera giovannonii]|uniref:3 beta-hydroxysteroid dehydrogenase/Delta 5-->4-isomerase n=1 Tax=Aquisphaera giovannonii TaxID=406548 RepID=A0A5B9VY65_9BACT|nr:NAD-dependent epimerase/dehydratase family protein [Aquisphaera giovannonii]QEH32665.1 3 beta-hydroxysteroid dehydrogenase/Delta 5-->4-isomerase [Aquisphaera giovannonii]
MSSESNGAGLVLVTGATGLLGSHVAERLVAAGHRVRALVRPSSRTGFLEGLGVEIRRGDLTDPASCEAAVAGARWVFHAAAKVGDWGAWREFQVGCIDATRTLAEAASRVGVGRFVHFSSTSAYGHPPDQPEPIDETAPLGQNVWVHDPYTRSKVESEELLWAMSRAGRLRLTVIRPSWLFGERDRTTIPRLIQEFRWHRVSIVGPGDNPLSAVYAGEVAGAAILAARDEGSAGEAYNVTSHGPITQRQFLDMLADAIGAPRVTWHYPFWYAYYGGLSLELRDRLRRRAKPPRVTRYGAWLLGRNLSYSTEKARRKLGWSPALTYEEAIARTVRWFFEDPAARIPRDPPPLLVRLGDARRRLIAPRGPQVDAGRP